MIYFKLIRFKLSYDIKCLDFSNKAIYTLYGIN